MFTGENLIYIGLIGATIVFVIGASIGLLKGKNREVGKWLVLAMSLSCGVALYGMLVYTYPGTNTENQLNAGMYDRPSVSYDDLLAENKSLHKTIDSLKADNKIAWYLAFTPSKRK